MCTHKSTDCSGAWQTDQWQVPGAPGLFHKLSQHCSMFLHCCVSYWYIYIYSHLQKLSVFPAHSVHAYYVSAANCWPPVPDFGTDKQEQLIRKQCNPIHLLSATAMSTSYIIAFKNWSKHHHTCSVIQVPNNITPVQAYRYQTTSQWWPASSSMRNGGEIFKRGVKNTR